MMILLSLTIFFFLLSTWLLPRTKSFERALLIAHFVFLLLFVGVITLLTQNLRFVGQYSNIVIVLIFLTCTIMLFVVTTDKVIKAYSGLIAIPVSLIFVGWLLFATAPLKKEKINDFYSLEVHQGGLFGPSILFYLIQRKGLFDKQYSISSTLESFSDISKLEVLSFQENKRIICKLYGYNTSKFFLDTLYIRK